MCECVCVRERKREGARARERGGEREREREGDHTNPELLHGMITVDSAMLHVGSHCGIGQVETVQCSMARIIMLAEKTINAKNDIFPKLGLIKLKGLSLRVYNTGIKIYTLETSLLVQGEP